MRQSQRYTALAALERRRPATFGGLGAEVCRPACTQGMIVARDGALAAASTTSRGNVGRGASPEASNFGFSSLPLLHGPPGDGGPSPMGLPAVAYTAGRLAPAGAG